MKFYVYEHWRPDTNVCFYVGKGSGRRAWSMRKRNKYHSSIVKKLELDGLIVDVRIIIENLSEETAFLIEKERISFYGRDNLANFTFGGEGFSGGRHTIESKEKISKAAKIYTSKNLDKMRERSLGEKNPFYGKTHTPEVRARLSSLLKGKKPPPRPPMSEENRKKLSDALKLKKIRPPSRKGIPNSKETRAKQSASLKAYWAKKNKSPA